MRIVTAEPDTEGHSGCIHDISRVPWPGPCGDRTGNQGLTGPEVSSEAVKTLGRQLAAGL